MTLLRPATILPTKWGRQAWISAGLSVTAVTLALVWLFRAPLGGILEVWRSSPSYGHGSVVVLLALGLTVLKRDRLAALSPRPWLWGLALAALAGLLALLGQIASAQLVGQVAFLLAFQALVLTVLGPRATGVVAFPLAYLVFAIPMGETLVPLLQVLAAKMTVSFLSLFGTTAVLDGFLIRTPSADYRIAEACAGLRFSLVGLAISVLAAYLLLRGWRRRAIYVLIALLVPPLANALRAAIAIALAERGVVDAGSLFSHFTYGLGFTSIVILCLLLLAFALRGAAPPSAAEGSGDVPRRGAPAPLGYPIAAASVLAVVLALATAPQWLGGAGGARVPGPHDLPPLPVAAPWQASQSQDEGWRPSAPGADATLLRSHRKGSLEVALFIAFFAEQREGAEVVSDANRVTVTGDWRSVAKLPVALSGAEPPQGLRHLKGLWSEKLVTDGRVRWAWRWYWVGGTFTANPVEAKLRQIYAGMIGGEKAAAVIVLSSATVEDAAAAQAAFEDLLAALPPLERWLAEAGAAPGRE